MMYRDDPPSLRRGEFLRIRIHEETRPTHRARRWKVGALVLASFAISACDSLLQVELPGNILESETVEPELAETLANGAQGHFDCWFQEYMLHMSLWTTETLYVFTSRNFVVNGLRDDWPTVSSDGGSGANCTGFYRPMHIARVQAERAAEVIGAMSATEVPGQDYLLAKADAYAAYVYQLAGETMCVMAYDAGPLQTRADSWAIAEARFTSAIQRAESVTSGPYAAEAKSILNMALVGRARARLYLGDDAGALADAQLVDPGFERLATASQSETFRNNLIYVRVGGLTRDASVGPDYHDLTVAADGRATQNDGVPDPRVPVVHFGVGTGFDGVTDMWGQLKYTAYDSPIPFATYREAQLMIAEVQGGQTAVDIINSLRSTVGDLSWVDPNAAPLPQFSSTDPVEIQEAVREERRRELWFQGTRIGDKLRWNEPWATGTNARGEEYNSAATCVPLHETEYQTNPNLR